MSATAAQLLYEAPYVRTAGKLPAMRAIDLGPTLSVYSQRAATLGPQIRRPAPFVPPPPSAVTTHSFSELLKSRTRPGRYGPAEVSHTAARCSPL
jgi:hypothetical protein